MDVQAIDSAVLAAVDEPQAGAVVSVQHNLQIGRRAGCGAAGARLGDAVNGDKIADAKLGRLDNVWA